MSFNFGGSMPNSGGKRGSQNLNFGGSSPSTPVGGLNGLGSGTPTPSYGSYRDTLNPYGSKPNPFGGSGAGVIFDNKPKVNVSASMVPHNFTAQVGIEHEGHSALIGVRNVPHYPSVDANAKITVWKSENQNTSIDVSAGASKNIKTGETQSGAGVGITHYF